MDRTRTAAGTPPAADTQPAAARVAELFSACAEACVAGRADQQVTILTAGCTTAVNLDPGKLSADGADVTVSLIEDDQPVTRATVAGNPSWSQCTLGDLRSVPLPPRAYDIVQCSSLLERIRHAELVLDRLISALKPGGLLLLRFCDRDSAAGFLDRVLPEAVRRAIWRQRRSGEPGPHPAVYERLVSARGIQSYAQMRGLVIAERTVMGGFAGGLPPGPPAFLRAQKLIVWLSRGRLTADHEELLYVLRKPEDRFARVL